jgi:hypothetical protein
MGGKQNSSTKKAYRSTVNEKTLGIVLKVQDHLPISKSLITSAMCLLTDYIRESLLDGLIYNQSLGAQEVSLMKQMLILATSDFSCSCRGPLPENSVFC